MRKLTLLILLIFLSMTSWANGPIVALRTNYGVMVAELYEDQAPITVANFLGYVNSGFYEGVIFHRVMKDFMIQAGAYDFYYQETG